LGIASLRVRKYFQAEILTRFAGVSADQERSAHKKGKKPARKSKVASRVPYAIIAANRALTPLVSETSPGRNYIFFVLLNIAGPSKITISCPVFS
jgi:hypothetical protein